MAKKLPGDASQEMRPGQCRADGWLLVGGRRWLGGNARNLLVALPVRYRFALAASVETRGCKGRQTTFLAA